jgi:hypothetical protein
MKDPNYETKIPQAVREQNDAKLTTINAEITALENTIKNFEKLA